jgi:hypothetical protein
MKKLYLFLWIMLLSTFQAAAYVFTYQGFQIRTDSTSERATITKFPTGKADINIPANGYFYNSDTKENKAFKTYGIEVSDTNTYIESIHIPANIDSIYQLKYLPNLKTITVDSNNVGLKIINGLLYYYESLVKIPAKIGDSITLASNTQSIDYNAESDCPSSINISIYLHSEIPDNISYWQFHTKEIIVHVPQGTKELYQASNWRYIASSFIDDIPCSNLYYRNIRYKRTGNNTVAIAKVLYAGSNAVSFVDKFTHNGTTFTVTSVKKGAFSSCLNRFDFVYFPDSCHISTIEDSAEISGYSISIPASVTKIGKNGILIQQFLSVSTGNNTYSSFNNVLYNRDLSKILYIPYKKVSIIMSKNIKTVNYNLSNLYISVDTANPYLITKEGVVYDKKTKALLYANNKSGVTEKESGSNKIELWDSTKIISDSAFCKLRRIILKTSSKNPSSIKVSNTSFVDCDSCVLRVPYGYANVYKSLDWVSNNPNCYYWHDSLGNYSYNEPGATKKYGFIIEEYSLKEPGSSFKANGILYKILSDGKSVEADSVVSWNSGLLPDSVSYDNSSFIVKGINGNLNKYSYLQNIPASVNSICANAFSGIRSKVTIHSRIVNPDSVCKGSTFNNVDKTIVLYVPVGTKNAYKKAKGWNQFATILEEGEQNPLDNNFRINGISYEKNSDGKTVTITGATANANTIPDSITYAGIHYAVTSVSYNALDSMKYVHIPASVLNIDYYNYLHGNIERFDVDSLNQNYASLDGILYDKKYSKIIYVPAKIKGRISLHDNLMMSKYDFTNRQITSATIPANITLEDDDSSFFYCSNLQSVYSYSKNPVGNWQSAFYGDSMATLYVPLGTKSLYVKQGADKSFRNIVEILIDKPIVNVSSTDSSNKVTITWERVTSAIKYHITLFRDKDLTDTVAHYWVAPDGTSLRSEKTYVNYTISGLQKGKYYFTLLAQGINERMGYAEGDFSILKEANATNIKTVSNDNAEIVSTRYFDLNGREIPAPHKNSISICVNRYSNGTNKSYKIFVR